MSGALDRLPRLLALVPYLCARPDAKLADVAATFGVTEAQLRRDLELVWMCGLPGHLPGDLIDVEVMGDRVTVSNADTIARPLRLTAQEALALVVALRALAETPGLHDGDAVRRALAKLTAVAGGELPAAERVTVAVDTDEATATTLRGALADGRRVHLRYWVPGRDEATERDVDPMRLLLADGRLYLEGYCRRVHDVRLFRLDRVLALDVLDAPAEPPPEARPRELTGGLYQPGPHDAVVTLRLRPRARWVADYYPVESVGRDGEDLLVRLRAAEVGWVCRLALRLGPEIQVVEPAALAEQVRAEAAAALAQYAAAG